MLFLKEFFEKVYLKKNQQATKIHEKLPSSQRVKENYFLLASKVNIIYALPPESEIIRK